MMIRKSRITGITLGEMLTLCREKKGMTQWELGLAVGIHANSISDFEVGRKTPRLRTAVRLARALGVSLDELTRGME